MDDALMRFRRAADRENRGRPLRRRYSPELQQQAVAYWHQQGREQGVRTMAAALGLSVTTLQRWTRAAAGRARFRSVEIVGSEPFVPSDTVAIQMTAAGPRVEGLTVETAARLLTLLR